MFAVIKKHIIVGAVITVVLAVIILLCALPSCGEKLDFSATFYYVCYNAPDNAHSAGSMSSVVNSYGGAGYVVEQNGGYYVTVSCYYEQRHAESVCSTLEKKGLNCFVLKVEADGYKLKGNAKKNSEKYEGNLNTLLDISKMCYNLANAMDGFSCDQAGAKTLLCDLRTGLDSLARQNTGNCFSHEIAALKARCADVSYGIVLSRDVRALQIAVCDCIANIKLY